MGRFLAAFMAAFTAFMFGCGIMALLVGLLWDRYSWQTGVIAMAGFWVIAFTLAVFGSRGRGY
jgi:fucose permease